MESEKIRATFERKGYDFKSYIDKKDFLRVINTSIVLQTLSRQTGASSWRKWRMNFGLRPKETDPPLNSELLISAIPS